jgi:hypothetical protein
MITFGAVGTIVSLAAKRRELPNGHFHLIDPERRLKTNAVNRSLVVTPVLAAHHKASRRDQHHLHAVELPYECFPSSVSILEGSRTVEHG